MSNPWKPASSHLEEGLRGLTVNDVHQETHTVLGKLVHNTEASKPLVMPIYHSSTYVLPSADSYASTISKGGQVYLRTGNPTSQEAECLLKNLEGGAGSLTFSSGMAAITTAISTVVQNGDHVVAQGQIYSGTHSYLENVAPRNGVETTWLENGTIEEFEKAIRPNTKLLVGESPSNPRMSVLDLEGFGKLGQEKGITTMVDSTFAPPSIQQPIKYGIDIVAHSATKYLGGHSDILGGVLTARSVDLWTKLNKMRMAVGNTMSPFEATLLTRGIKTLHMRVEKQCNNALALAKYLHDHPAIETVYYPGLPSHPGHDIAKKQMKAFGGMVTFDIKGGLQAAKKLAESLRVIQLAVSLGGVESLIEHPASMTHGDLFMSPEARKKAFITDGLLRMSVGIENVEDLRRDLQQALADKNKQINKKINSHI